MLENDKKTMKDPTGGSGTSLTRAINRMVHVCNFVCRIFINLLNSDEKKELKACLSEAYPETLARIHTWMVKKSVGVAISAGSPYRAAFSKSLGLTEEDIHAKAPLFTDNSTKVYNFMEAEYTRLGIPFIFSPSPCAPAASFPIVSSTSESSSNSPIAQSAPTQPVTHNSPSTPSS